MLNDVPDVIKALFPASAGAGRSCWRWNQAESDGGTGTGCHLVRKGWALLCAAIHHRGVLYSSSAVTVSAESLRAFE
jgi:hypothetical protein